MADHQGFNSFLTPSGSHPKSLAHNWDLHKSTIKKLYVDSRKSLEYVMKTIEREHNFQASKKVYRRKLAKWGFEKKMKRSEKEAITRKFIERGAIGKKPAFTLRGRVAYLWEAFDYDPPNIAKFLSQGSSGAATPPHLRCYTPEPDTWQARQSAHFLQKYAKDIEAYKTQSTEMGALTSVTGLQDNNPLQLVAKNTDSNSRDCESQGLPKTSQVSYTLEAATQSELSCGSLYA